MKLRVLAALAGGLVSLAVTSASAATLVSADGDRTVVQEGAKAYAFLDLSNTTGLNAAEANTAFASEGFALATIDEVNLLFSAFGIDPFPAPVLGSLTKVDVNTGADIAGLLDAIGQTSPNGQSIARFSFGSDVGELCISTVANCALSTGWVFGTERAESALIGNFVVAATDVAPVPLPAGAVLMLTGLAGLGFARRRRTA